MRTIVLGLLLLLLMGHETLAQQQPPAQAPGQTQSANPPQVKKCRSAKTGEYVTAGFAKKHPKTTVCESK